MDIRSSRIRAATLLCQSSTNARLPVGRPIGSNPAPSSVHPIMDDFVSAGRGEGRTLRGQYTVNDLLRRLRCSDQSARVQYLLSRNREVFHTSALFGNVEGQRLRRRAVAGILHVVHLAGRGYERLDDVALLHVGVVVQ